MSEDEDNKETFRFPESTTYSAIGTFVGVVSVFFMVVLGLIFPEEASGMDQAKPITDFKAIAMEHTSEITILVVLDSIFIMGYLSLFVGLWLLVRDFSEVMSRLGLTLGMLVGFFDIVENTLLLVLVNGMQTGWMPDDKLFGYIFLLNTFIDLLSYLAALIYAIIFLVIFRPWDGKFTIGALLVLYVLIGLGSIILPGLFIIRSLMFVIGLITGGIVLAKEEDISTEVLEDLLSQQKQGSKGDFV